MSEVVGNCILWLPVRANGLRHYCSPTAQLEVMEGLDPQPVVSGLTFTTGISYTLVDGKEYASGQRLMADQSQFRGKKEMGFFEPKVLVQKLDSLSRCHSANTEVHKLATLGNNARTKIITIPKPHDGCAGR